MEAWAHYRGKNPKSRYKNMILEGPKTLIWVSTSAFSCLGNEVTHTTSCQDSFLYVHIFKRERAFTGVSESNANFGIIPSLYRIVPNF